VLFADGTPYPGSAGDGSFLCWFQVEPAERKRKNPVSPRAGDPLPGAGEQTLIISLPKLRQMVNGIVLPIKKVFSLVDSKITVEIKDEGKKLQGRLVAVDEYLNIHMEETMELAGDQRGRSLGTVVIRGNNILSISPVL
jgi:small nuclear ribonucleoprotein (snRNP)-like protein